MEQSILPIIVLFSGLFLGLVFGLPMGFTMGCAGILSGFLLVGPPIFFHILSDTYGVMNSLIMVAVPLYIFMATVLEKCGIAEELYTAMHHWLGPVRGGLGMATIFICTIIAALSGISAAGTVTMGLIALPIMLKKNYHKSIAIGPILVGGPLGLLIPPSIGFIIYGMLTQTSIGRLFAGGILPGLLLAGMYVTYIGVRCYLRPQDGPALPLAERIPLKEKILLLKGLILPFIIIIGVLGSIFAGIASPTESAAIGALGAVVASIVNRRFSWKLMKESAIQTASITGMIMFILFGAYVFSSVLIQTGGPSLVKEFILGLDMAPLLVVFVMQLVYFFLGFFFEETTMLFLTVPVFMPILVGLGFDPVWFGIVFILNLQTAFLTPPFGFSLFFMKGIAPPEVSTMDIYRSVLPFLLIQWIAILLVMFFPQLALWLPDVVFQLK